MISTYSTLRTHTVDAYTYIYTERKIMKRTASKILYCSSSSLQTKPLKKPHSNVNGVHVSTILCCKSGINFAFSNNSSYQFPYPQIP